MEKALNAFRVLLLVAGFLLWVIGGNVVLAGARKRLGWRQPTRPPLSKLTRVEAIKLVSFLAMFFASFVAFILLGPK